MSSTPSRTLFSKYKSHLTSSACSSTIIFPALVVGCYPSEFGCDNQGIVHKKKQEKKTAQQRASSRPSCRTVGGLPVFLPVGEGAQVVGGCLVSLVGGLVLSRSVWAGAGGPEGMPSCACLGFIRSISASPVQAF